MGWRVDWRRRIRQSEMNGSLPRTKRRFGNHPVRCLLRLLGSFQVAMRIICCGELIERSSCPTRSDGQSFGQRAFGPAHYS
jgi:hypothetical protein